MSILSNFVGGISAFMFERNSAQESNHKLDINNNTFENTLNEARNKMESLNSTAPEKRKSSFSINIGEMDGYNTIDKINKSNTDNNIEKFNKSDNYTTSEILTFFPSVFNSKQHLMDASNHGLFNFEKKLATSSYMKGARNIVTDVSEFVEDALKIS